MIRTLPTTKPYRIGYGIFAVAYFIFLFAPLVIVAVLAFNDSMFPSLPWYGFTLDWFIGKGPKKVGLFYHPMNMTAILTSLQVALGVALLSTAVGTCAAFLFEQEEFPFKRAFYLLMIAPMVVPGVILGISILSFANSLGVFLEKTVGVDLRVLSPGLPLVTFGQTSFITTFVTLVIIARLKKFDRTLEEAAYNLGATRFEVIWHITLKYLRPSIIGGAAVAFLLSFENFNTTLFLIGSKPTLPIALFAQIRDGGSPVVNAVSVFLMFCMSVIALGNLYFARKSQTQ
ncbi:MAG TPA: ABC transporter permease [Sedimentisphaerales bacterium]|nr:ABC transporter permease [Sedimentisphaerales bacterium]